MAGETTLWNYSSANGVRYPNGWTDVATGDVYGRTGGNGGRGSGDGGRGGKGGSPGYWYVKGVWHYDDGHVYPGTSEGGEGVDPNHKGPGHWENVVVMEKEPTKGSSGSSGATGSAILYWEPPEVIEE